jgi:hypothetical protein
VVVESPAAIIRLNAVAQRMERHIAIRMPARSTARLKRWAAPSAVNGFAVLAFVNTQGGRGAVRQDGPQCVEFSAHRRRADSRERALATPERRCSNGSIISAFSGLNPGTRPRSRNIEIPINSASVTTRNVPEMSAGEVEHE